jgi:tRNA pseudouridine55 synthase
MIIPVWQELGQSTHQIAKNLGSDYQTKATHTGTLDPMAEGIVIVLTHEDRLKKSEFSKWKKTYEFEILWGISTDSLDLLGLVNEISTKNLDFKIIETTLVKILPQLIGTYQQTQPQFSAQRINGKSGFDLAKQKIEFKPKENEITIASLEILGTQTIKTKQLQKIIPEKINLIQGNFRQQEILQQWQKTFSQLENKHIQHLPVTKFRAVVSKRTYIRALVDNIAQLLNYPITTFAITRTQNGPYTEDDIILRYEN